MSNKSDLTLIKRLLISITIGVWVLVLQNFNLFNVPRNVEVDGGYINSSVIGNVSVRGSVDVDNTVSVSIDEVLDKDGKKYYYKNY
jgi:hypothetical protein